MLKSYCEGEEDNWRNTGCASQPEPAVEVTLDKRYLNFPVNNRAPKRRMSLAVDGKLLGQFGIRQR